MRTLISHQSGFYPHPQEPRISHGRPDKILISVENNLKSTLNDSFLFFPLLPTELRLLVWEMAIEEQRVVVIGNRLKKDPLDPYEFRGYKSLTPAPVTLYVCSESRALSLSKYDLISGLGDEKALQSPRAGVFFNYKRDILYLRNVWDKHYRLMNDYSPTYGSAQSFMELFLKCVLHDQLHQIQSIALDLYSSFPIMSLYFTEKAQLKGLRNIYLCSEDANLNVKNIQLQPLADEHHEYFKGEAKTYFGLPLRSNIIGPKGWEIPDVGHIECNGLQRYPDLLRALEAKGTSNLKLANAVNPT